MQTYPLFRKENIRAYASVMAAWAALSALSAAVLMALTNSLPFPIALLWAAVTTMLGMAIMFVASLLNLRKLTPGFRRLAQGEPDPNIPPVWCPVLTAATNAAVELTARLNAQDQS